MDAVTEAFADAVRPASHAAYRQACRQPRAELQHLGGQLVTATDCAAVTVYVQTVWRGLIGCMQGYAEGVVVTCLAQRLKVVAVCWIARGLV